MQLPFATSHTLTVLSADADTMYLPSLLYNADLSIDVTGKEAGKEVGFDRRIENIGNRHGFDSKQYEMSKRLKDELIELKQDA